MKPTPRETFHSPGDSVRVRKLTLFPPIGFDSGPPCEKVSKVAGATIWKKQYAAKCNAQTRPSVPCRFLQSFADKPSRPQRQNLEEFWFGTIVDKNLVPDKPILLARQSDTSGARHLRIRSTSAARSYCRERRQRWRCQMPRVQPGDFFPDLSTKPNSLSAPVNPAIANRSIAFGPGLPRSPGRSASAIDCELPLRLKMARSESNRPGKAST